MNDITIIDGSTCIVLRGGPLNDCKKDCGILACFIIVDIYTESSWNRFNSTNAVPLDFPFSVREADPDQCKLPVRSIVTHFPYGSVLTMNVCFLFSSDWTDTLISEGKIVPSISTVFLIRIVGWFHFQL